VPAPNHPEAEEAVTTRSSVVPLTVESSSYNSDIVMGSSNNSPLAMSPLKRGVSLLHGE
jgi:hypothetical protein